MLMALTVETLSEAAPPRMAAALMPRSSSSAAAARAPPPAAAAAAALKLKLLPIQELDMEVMELPSSMEPE
jgi:hypothetical protein